MAVSSYVDDTANWFLTVIAVLLVSWVSASCHQVRGLPDRHLRDLPEASELAGTWKIDDNSIQRLRSTREPLTKTNVDDHLLILRKDGTCLFKTYWDFQSDDNYATSEGHWKSAYRA